MNLNKLAKELRFVMSHTRFRVNPHSIVALMPARSRREILSLSDCN